MCPSNYFSTFSRFRVDISKITQTDCKTFSYSSEPCTIIMSDFTIIKNSFFKDSKLSFMDKSIMSNFLRKASHKEFKLKSGTLLNRGQFVTSFRDLSQEIEVSKKSIECTLKRLEKLGEIKVTTQKSGTLIEVLKYDEYIYTQPKEHNSIEIVETKQDFKEPTKEVKEDTSLIEFRKLFSDLVESKQYTRKDLTPFYNVCIRPCRYEKGLRIFEHPRFIEDLEDKGFKYMRMHYNISHSNFNKYQ